MRPQVLLFLLFPLALCQIHCSDDPAGEDHVNMRPSVAIVEGATDSSSVDYRVDFSWRGRDEDGDVTGFEWAIDDTVAEDSWSWTNELGGLFTFRAASEPEDPADSLFHDWHRFFVRAVDDASARSEADSRYFNATTIAPRTTITYPVITSRIIRQPTWVEVVWEGEDLDATNREKAPEFYEYKLAEIFFDDDPVERLLEGENVLLDTLDVSDPTAWIRVTSDVTTLLMTDLHLPELYVFGVRAVDEAGAVEPTLEFGTNVFIFETTGAPCTPIVTIYEAGFAGGFKFPIDGVVWNVHLPSGTPIHFSWVGDLGYCGRRPGKVKYCLDDTDCVDWSDISELVEPFIFPHSDDGKTHDFVLWMRDDRHDPRSERECKLKIHVFGMPLDKTVLIVDDASPPRVWAGTDSEHDAFILRVFSPCLEPYLGPDEEIDWYNMYGADDRVVHPSPIPLEVIGRYKLVIWNGYFYGRAASGLSRSEYERKVLSTYVKAGGHLFLYGPRPIGGLAGDDYKDAFGDGICPDLPDVHDPAWDEDSFIWRFLHIRNCIRSARSGRQLVDGWVGARPVHPLFPDININTDVWDPYEIGSQGMAIGGITAFQCYKKSSESASSPDPGLDTIYVAKAFEYQGHQSPLDGTPVALRYESTAEDSAQGLAQGRVYLQMFDYIFVDEATATEAASQAIDWLFTGRDE
jgi:hypothetical protein